MKRVFMLILALLLLSGCAVPPETEAVHQFTDSTGQLISLEKPPERTAVLFSSLADLWVTVGGTVEITVGETVERGFAPEGTPLVDDGAGKTVDLERLIALKPDLVIYAADVAGQRDCAETLRSAGIPAAGFHVEDFSDYLEVLELCTRLLDTPERYNTWGEKLKTEIDGTVSDASGKSVSYLFVRAGSSAKYTKAKSAENHFVCAMADALGGENIADAAPVLLDGLSMEEILTADPEVILFSTMGEDTAGEAYMNSLLSDPIWSRLSAVKTGRVHQLPRELFHFKPNARWAEAYETLFHYLYGDGNA